MSKRVYVLGAGFSAGLGFPLTTDLLPLALSRLGNDDRHSVERILEFHFPNFRPGHVKTYPNIEDVLTRIRVNIDLFHATRRDEGRLRVADLRGAEMNLLHVLSQLFHDIRAELATPAPAWLQEFVEKVKGEQATIISFNWDLVLDVLLGGDIPERGIYGMGIRLKNNAYLLKPHGSLNWYGEELAQHFREGKKWPLWEPKKPEHKKFKSVWLFKHPREPKTSVPGRQYVPLIVPPTYVKSFEHPFFQGIFQFAVERLGEAREVLFLGFSMPQYDFHAEFLLRCGFHVQKEGNIISSTRRSRPRGPAKVTAVNPDPGAAERIGRVLGVDCAHEQMSVATWIRCGKLK